MKGEENLFFSTKNCFITNFISNPNGNTDTDGPEIDENLGATHGSTIGIFNDTPLA